MTESIDWTEHLKDCTKCETASKLSTDDYTFDFEIWKENSCDLGKAFDITGPPIINTLWLMNNLDADLKKVTVSIDTDKKYKRVHYFKYIDPTTLELVVTKEIKKKK